MVITETIRGPGAGLTREDVNQRLKAIPFVRMLKLHAGHIGHGRAVSRLKLRPALAAPGNNKVLSDGALLSALDQTGSMAIWSAFGLYFPHATVSLSASLLCVAETSILECEAHLLSTEGGICYTKMTARDAASGRVIAHAMGNFIGGAYPGGKMDDRVPKPTAHHYTDDGAAEEWQSFGETFGIDISGNACVVPPDDRIIGSTDPIALHGGVIAAGLAEAASRNVDDKGSLRLTHLAIEFLHSGLPAQTTFRPSLVHRSGRTATLRTDAYQSDDTRLVATATLRFTNFRPLERIVP